MKPAFQAIWRITGTKPWRILSLLLLFACILVFCGIVFLVISHNVISQRPSDSEFLAGPAAVSEVSIPVQFLPDYDIEYLPDGKVSKTLKYGQGIIETTSDKVALVLVDTWVHSSSPTQEGPIGYHKNISALLDTYREHGVTIIHAPNHPVVDKYEQYHTLRNEIGSFLSSSLPERIVLRVLSLLKEQGKIYDWPPPEFQREVKQIRQEAKAKHYLGPPVSERDISRFLRPRENEFVVESIEEFRYVLWLRKISLLLYVGGNTNE
ncbi:MAG: hypothetical protein JSV32_07735, partial [Dehalococcoidia bacterium]